jgi:hypothetical protein
LSEQQQADTSASDDQQAPERLAPERDTGADPPTSHISFDDQTLTGEEPKSPDDRRF